MSKPRKPRVRRGYIPHAWNHLCTSADGEWFVYRNPASDDDWQAVKVASVSPRRERANFSIGWSRREGRFADSAEWESLGDRHPSLQAEIATRIPALCDAQAASGTERT